MNKSDKYRHLFSEEEWDWFKVLGAEKHDPEEKRVFYQGVIAKKQADKTYDLFSDFPREKPEFRSKQDMADFYVNETRKRCRWPGREE